MNGGFWASIYSDFPPKKKQYPKGYVVYGRSLTMIRVFFSSKDLLLFSTEKSFFVFVLITFFFCLKEFTFFSTQKKFFFYPNFYCPQKVTKSCSKTIAHICFSFPPFGRGGAHFFMAKICLKTPAHVLKTHVRRMSYGGGVDCRFTCS